MGRWGVVCACGACAACGALGMWACGDVAMWGVWGMWVCGACGYVGIPGRGYAWAAGTLGLCGGNDEQLHHTCRPNHNHRRHALNRTPDIGTREPPGRVRAPRATSSCCTQLGFKPRGARQRPRLESWIGCRHEVKVMPHGPRWRATGGPRRATQCSGGTRARIGRGWGARQTLCPRTPHAHAPTPTPKRCHGQLASPWAPRMGLSR